MPPKGSGARGGRPAGRGRGRGKASESSQPEASSAAGPEIKIEPGTQPTFAGSSAESSAHAATTQHLQDVDPSPNSSPATIPTETPAPTPIRPPTQRSESVASNHAPSASVGSGTRGKKTAAPSKFKPKMIRRDQSEREELARAEKERLDAARAEKEREEARREAAASRGGGRGFHARGRGNAMGRGRDERKLTATGIFGVAPEQMALQGAHRVSSSFYGPNTRGEGSGSGIKKEYTGSGGSGGGGGGGGGGFGGDRKNFIPEPMYPEEDGDDPKVDIEMINLVSDDEAPASTSRGKGKGTLKKGMKPVRLHREEHKERTTIVNTDPSTKLPAPKEAEDPDSDEPLIDEALSSHKIIKQEPDEDFQNKEAPQTQNSSRKPGGEEPTQSDAAEVTDEALAKAKRTKKARQNSTKKSKKPVLQTEEDRAEYARHLEDVAILARELGGMQASVNTTGRDADGDVDMQEPPKETADREGRLYLFQFPPVLPKLYNPIKTAKPMSKGALANIEDPASKGKDIQMSGTDKGKQPAGTTTVDGKEIKTEEDIPKPIDKQDGGRRGEIVPEEGYIGKLIVRESGKVELCWGGTSLAVGRGVDAGFLTTGVVVDSKEQGIRPGVQPHTIEGKALGMGTIMGKFVVTPDWEKM